MGDKDKNNSPALSLQDVSIGYGKKTVIKSLTLTVGNGETFGLIGLNGAGKTTLIKTLLGLKDPDSGKIEIAGNDRRNDETRQQIAYLPERFEPPWFLKGIEFLRFSTRLYKTPFTVEKAHEAARLLALDPAVLGNRVQTYSKGMRQKLGLLATLLTGCPILVLDEPMSGLDPKARTLVKDALQRVRQEGRTIFLSSHILTDMNEICDQLAIMDGGAVIFTGTPASLKKRGNEDNIERAFLRVIEEKQAA